MRECKTVDEALTDGLGVFVHRNTEDDTCSLSFNSLRQPGSINYGITLSRCTAQELARTILDMCKIEEK